MTESPAFPQQIIARKRDGGVLTSGDIDHFVAGLCDQSWSDAQVSALAMAILCRGMDTRERTALTRGMTRSGTILQWPRQGLRGPLLDKHSTGGVGDKVSLILAPILAACDCHVPMISGRGLAHTGGTLDKLETIEGFNTQIPEPRFQAIVREVGCAIVGQSAALAPADRRLYAIRDVTGTVPSRPLIVASILSKKLAAGLDGLVMDIKCGSGGFMTTAEQARQLAVEIIDTAAVLGLPAHALVTDMNAPLGTTVGHALEVTEALDFLSGEHRDARLGEVTLKLCAQALALGGTSDPEHAVEAALASGRAAEFFARMVAAQGGPSDIFAMPKPVPRAPVKIPLVAAQDGAFAGFDALQTGTLVMSMGGGRRQASDRIDPGVGLSHLCPPGTVVQRGDRLALVHGNDRDAAQTATRELSQQIHYDTDSSGPPLILDTLRCKATSN